MRAPQTLNCEPCGTRVTLERKDVPFAFERAQLVANLVVQGDHCGPLLNESPDRGKADSRGRAGDERDLLLR